MTRNRGKRENKEKVSEESECGRNDKASVDRNLNVKLFKSETCN